MSNQHTLATRPVEVCVFAAVAGLLLAVAGEGPDFGLYADWAAAALSGDVFRLSGNVLSPVGVPFSLAAAGPGLLFAVGKAPFSFLSLGSAAMLTGWIATLAFWASAFVVFRRVTAGREWLAVLGAGMLFVGTHAGLYSHSYATEAFANALIAALWAIALTRDRWRLYECATVGALAGLLLLVRAHVVLYAVPALWLAVFGGTARFAAPHGLKPTPEPGGAGASPSPERPPDWWVIRLAATVMPIAIAAAEYAIVNRWMTGSPLHPPYLYGGAGFTSVDLAHPQVAAVLLHPWHGLLSYHPLYGLACIAVAIAAWRGGRYRALWTMTVLAALAHVWVQAGWYIWWLGGSTFGMRGMAPAALPLVAGLIALIDGDLDRHPPRASTWLWAGALACTWSYPLLLAGNTRYLAWGPLFDAQKPALAGVAVVLVAWAYRLVTRRAATVDAVERECRVMAFLLAAAVVAYLAWQLASMPAVAVRGAIGVFGAVLVVLAIALFNGMAATGDMQLNHGSGTGGRAAPGARRAVATVVLAVFVAQAFLFARLAVRTELYLAAGASPPRPFPYISASPVDELRVTYAEYREVPGFEARKAAFRRFLAWQRIEASRLAPPDRQIADTVRRRVEAEPRFGDLLVEATVHGGIVAVTARGITDEQQSRVRELALGVPGVMGVTFSAD